MSGPRAHEIALALFRARTEGPPARFDALRFGRFVGRDGAAVDHGYLVLFEKGRAYTAEPTAELWTHGSPAVLGELIAAALALGAAPAEPGEFTYRALRNGRLDLARAEAVRDLIAAQTAYQARTALAQAEGALSRRLAPLREDLLDLIVRVEAAVEFVDESETHLSAGSVAPALADLEARCLALLAGFRAGRLVREGASLVLSGLPNVGKSSLFNRLLERDRAIVTAEPGTTRDVLEETLDIGGIPVRLLDTAGLRDTPDAAEGEGVRRARRALESADLVVHVIDGSIAPSDGVRRETGSTAKVTLAWNKADLVHAPRPALMGEEALWVSARTGEGIDLLRERLRVQLLGTVPSEEPILTNARHAAALERAAAAIGRAATALRAGFTEEYLLEELGQALAQLGSITGEVTADDVLERVFSTFCIGK